MSEKTLKKINLIYGIIISILLCVVGVLFIVMCVDIYKTGPSPFTRESVSEHFSKIAVFVYVLICFIVLGAVLSIVTPLEKKSKGKVNDALVLHNLSSRLNKVSSDGCAKIEKQRILRLVMVVISILLVVTASVVSFVSVLNSFDASKTDINGEMIKGCLSILRYFIVPVVYLIVTAYVCKFSIKKELEIVKSELKNAKINEGVAENTQLGTFTKLSQNMMQGYKNASSPKKWHKVLGIIIKLVVACLAITFIVLGVLNGGMGDVLTKAINICTECIGMG